MRVLFIIGFFFFYGGMNVSFAQHSDPDSLPNDTTQIDHVIVDKGTEENAHSQPASIVGNNDFYRNMALWRVPLNHPQNKVLIKAINPSTQNNALPIYASNGEGMMFHLLEGVRTGKIQSFHPQDLEKRYDYFDLVSDLMVLDGLDETTPLGSVAVESLGWEYLNTFVDLIVEEGFSKENSQAFMRIRYIRILWYDPQSPKGIYVLAVVPYEKARLVLEELIFPFEEQGKEMRIRLQDILEKKLFFAHKIPLGEDGSYNLAPHRRSPEALQNRWPELWKN